AGGAAGPGRQDQAGGVVADDEVGVVAVVLGDAVEVLEDADDLHAPAGRGRGQAGQVVDGGDPRQVVEDDEERRVERPPLPGRRLEGRGEDLAHDDRAQRPQPVAVVLGGGQVERVGAAVEQLLRLDVVAVHRGRHHRVGV